MRSDIAIIIPYYRLAFFRETLESLAAQTDDRFVVYIGDDASPENPSHLLREFAGKFKFLYKRFDNNLGGNALTKQWERCVDMIHDEEWFMILGDDDVLGPAVISSFFQHAICQFYGANVVRFSTQLIDETSQYSSNVWKQPELEYPLDSYHRKEIQTNRGSLSELIFKVTAYKQSGFRPFGLGWYADDFALIDFSGGKPIYSINDEIVFVRVSNISISGKTDNLKIKKEATNLAVEILLRDYLTQMREEVKVYYIRKYHEMLFRTSQISFLNFMYLNYLTIRFVSWRLGVLQWKMIIHKLLIS